MALAAQPGEVRTGPARLRASSLSDMWLVRSADLPHADRQNAIEGIYDEATPGQGMDRWQRTQLGLRTVPAQKGGLPQEAARSAS